MTRGECRVACHWEYARETHKIVAGSFRNPDEFSAVKQTTGTAMRGSAKWYCPVNYRQPARELFPQPWTTLTKEQRASVLGSFYPIPALQVRKLGDFLKRIQWPQGANGEVVRRYFAQAYVIQPFFSLHGVEEIIKEFKIWARKEAKNYRQSPRAKGAELPFDALRWLTVWRLDQARRKAHVNFAKTQEALEEYRRQNPLAHENDVSPIYTSPGAWSKARSDAERCRGKSMEDAAFLLAELS